MSESRINTALLARVKAHILEEPRRYDQTVGGMHCDSSPCGTAACIAGWAVFLESGDDPAVVPVLTRAEKLLGLNYHEAGVLFSADAESDWPEPYRAAYERAMDMEDLEGMARAAADYLQHIIDTGKVLE